MFFSRCRALSVVVAFSLDLVVVALAASAAVASPWDAPGLAGDPQAVLQAANAVPVGKDADVDVLLEEQRFVIDQQGRVTLTSKYVYRINTDSGVRNWANAGIVWEPWHQSKPEIAARVITPDGTEHVLDPATLVDAPARENSPATFDDNRVYHGPLPAVRIGAIVEEQVVVRDTAPFSDGGVLRRIGFGRNMPVQYTRLVVEVPAATPLHYTVHLLPKANAKKEQIGDTTRLSIEQGFLEAYEQEEPNLPRDIPRHSHVDFSTGQSWADVAQRYSKLVEEQLQLEAVKPLLPKIRGRRQQVIQELVTRLHKEVRYTGLEFGRSKIVPQTPAEVLKRKYGDCKDKATVLVAMLRASGIPAYVALMRASDREDPEEDMPGLGLFDHAVVFVPGQGLPDLWIDATADLNPVGTLPPDDQGRMALIMRPETHGLVRTPEAKSTDNVNFETSEFFLSEFGPARVVETSIWHGNSGASLRGEYRTMTDDKRKRLESYFKSTYSADGDVKVDTQGEDVSKPFTLRLEAAKARRGNTGENDAAVAMWPQALLNLLPQPLTEADDDNKNDRDKNARKKTERTQDFLLPEAFVMEWRYRIVPPPGFQVHALPEYKTFQIGPATLSQEFKTGADGVVIATFRFDSVKRRYTPGEVKEIRAAVQKAKKVPVMLLSFDSTGYVLMKSGKIREALADYRKLIKLHPNEALHHAQLANALLQAGLAESARKEAREATRLEPTSATAYKKLAWVLEHDLIGRRLEPGFDLEGSIAAYRKAKELDPKDAGTRAGLAILLEHDRTGERYTTGARLDEAIAEYRGLKEADKSVTDYDDNLALALFYAKRFQEAQDFVGELAPSRWRNAIRVASLAGLKGGKAAIEYSSSASQNENERNTALYDAGTLLARLRMYAPAVELMSAGTASQTNSPEVLALLESLRRAKPVDDLPKDFATPEDAFRYSYVLARTPGALDELLGIFSKNYLAAATDGLRKQWEQEIQSNAFEMRGEWPSRGWLDRLLGGLKITKEGNDAIGYNIRIQRPNGGTYNSYIVKEDGKYKVLAPYGMFEPLGHEALARIHSGDVEGAKKWLDRAREISDAGDAEDPLSQQPFRQFWPAGENPGKEAIEYAAALLMVYNKHAAQVIPILERGRQEAKTDAARSEADKALAEAYYHTNDYKKMAEVADALMKAYPTSLRALRYYREANQGLKNWIAVESALQAAIKRMPDEPQPVRTLAQVEIRQGKFAEARALFRTLIDSGRANGTDMNNYAWLALFAGKVEDEDIQLAQRGLSMQNNSSFATAHTLACLYAEVGQAKQARDLLVSAMEAGNMDEPNSAIWYAMGRIAEQYGEYAAARDAYSRADKGEEDTPDSAYQLAQARMRIVEAELRNSEPSTKRAAGAK